MLVEALTRTRGPEHPDVATALYQWARLNAEHDFEHTPEMQILHKSLGSGLVARNLYLSSLKIREKACGQSHRDFAQSAYGVATCSPPADAIELSRRALAIQEATLGADSGELALTLNGLAGAHSASGDARTALQLFVRALEVHRKAAAKRRYVDEAAELSATAAARLKTGAADESIQALRQALQIQQLHMSNAYFDMTYRICADSLSILPMILDLHRTVFLKEGQLALATTLNGLADAHRALGDTGAALPYLEEAADVRRRLNART